jgi:2-hydroxy-6-oxonona-2,4-dienedioate hydrolase
MIAYPFEVGRWRTRVLEAGTGRRAVVFIHGLGARADRWRANLEPVARSGYHCYALDLPGHGFADKGPGFAYGVPGFAAFVRDLMTGLGVAEAALVGTSLGGHIAAWLALERAAGIRGLVLVGATGLAPLGEAERQAIARNVRDTSREGTERKLRFVLGDAGLVTPDWVEEEWRINTSAGAAQAFDLLARYFVEPGGIVSHGVGDRLAELRGRIPVLLVWGKADQVVPVAVGEQAAARLPGARLATISDVGHLPYLERAEDFNRIVLDFVGRAWPERRAG